MNKNEEKANEFLNYVAKNEKELKRSVKKNITNDIEIFDDVFNETIIKIYNSIMKNGTEIKDLKQYFFLSCKFTFIYRQNKKRKQEIQAVRDFFDNSDIQDETEDYEKKYNDIINALSDIKEKIREKYGEYYADIFFEYYTLKANQHISYKKLAAEKNISTRKISEIINVIKEYISSDEEIQKYKSIFYEEY